MSQRRLGAIIAVLLVGAVGIGIVRSRPAAPPVATMSDGAMKAVMVETLTTFADSTSAVPRANGVPDIAVTDGVLIVTTTAPAAAAGLCRTVAGMTNDQDTGKPLPIVGVVIISGGEQVADCRP